MVKIPANLNLITTKRTDQNLLYLMDIHYSKPKGFVGRNICYAIYYDDIYFGHIVGGSATLYLPGRNEFFGIDKTALNTVVNNIFFHVLRHEKYPCRNFTSAIVYKYMSQIETDWYEKYADKVLGHETLVELPRTGILYRRAGFIEVGRTKGYTCKRVAGKSTDSYTGKRVWNYKELRPKIVLCRKATENS